MRRVTGRARSTDGSTSARCQRGIRDRAATRKAVFVAGAPVEKLSGTGHDAPSFDRADAAFAAIRPFVAWRSTRPRFEIAIRPAILVTCATVPGLSGRAPALDATSFATMFVAATQVTRPTSLAPVVDAWDANAIFVVVATIAGRSRATSSGDHRARPIETMLVQRAPFRAGASVRYTPAPSVPVIETHLPHPGHVRRATDLALADFFFARAAATHVEVAAAVLAVSVVAAAFSGAAAPLAIAGRDRAAVEGRAKQPRAARIGAQRGATRLTLEGERSRLGARCARYQAS